MAQRNPYSAIRASRERPAPAAKRASERPAPRKGLAVRPQRVARDRKDERLFDERGDFNPQRYDHDSSKRASLSRTNRPTFDKRGQVNAYNKKDALVQIKNLLQDVTPKNAGRLSMHPADEQVNGGLSKEARREILARALRDGGERGFKLVGQELALPIKRILDYEGFARKIFRVRELAQAELFRIPLDVRATAWVIGQDGMTPESRIKSRYVMPDETKITSAPSVDLHDLYLMNFDVLDRAQDTARQEIELAEDKRAIAMLLAASTVDNTVTGYGSLGLTPLEAARYQVERHRLVVENFLINRAELSDIVTTMSAAVDPVTERELILAGYIGNVLGCQILTAAGTGVEQVIPAGTFYAVTGKDYLGEMGERVSLFSEPYNKYAMGETVKGWMFCEIIGFCVANSFSVARGTK